MRKCYNKACGKELAEGDFPHGWDSGKSHLCNECWRRFDDQKMRGRFACIGFATYSSQKELMESLVNAGYEIPDSGWDLRRSVDELRYTENLDEWIRWQMEKYEAKGTD